MLRVEERLPADATPARAHRWLALLVSVVGLVLPGVVLAEADLLAPSGGALAEADLLALNDAKPPRALPQLGGDAGEETLADDEGDWGDDAWLEDDFSLDDEFEEAGGDDPLEGFNRGVFAFNDGIDRFALSPITSVYQTLVPAPGRTGIQNAFLNLDAPVRMTNAMLQGRPKASGIALARFILNTTFGLGGLIDVGSRVGLEKQRADFGQTLATWGTPQGPYIVFPFLGPMTARSGVGMGVDFVMQPISYVAGPLPSMFVGVGKDFSRREQVNFELAMLREGSLDFYASLRSAFLQDRADLVAEGELDAGIADMADAGSDPAMAALSPAAREAVCLAHPRARRDMHKPGMRAHVRRRCAVTDGAL